MPILRLPIFTGVDPEGFNDGVINQGSSTSNLLYSKFSDERIYATQRPLAAIDQRARDFNASNRGRGIAYWESQKTVYVVNDDKVYRGAYTGEVGRISPGKDPVYIMEIGIYLVFLDPENNEAWALSQNSPETLVQISQGAHNFPFFGNSVKMAGGGVVLNGTLYIMDTDGKIWNSAINDPLSWSGIDFLTAEIEYDTGIFLTKQLNHVIAISSKSIEIFYDAGNPVGSPLQRRDDISYMIGGYDRRNVFNLGQAIFFIGAEKKGSIGVFSMEGLQLKKISTDSIDYFIGNTLSTPNMYFLSAGATISSHNLMFLTAAVVDAQRYSGTTTLVYDASAEKWTTFETRAVREQSPCFPVIDSSERVQQIEDNTLMFANGDLFRFRMDGAVLDQEYSSSYVDPEYIVDQDNYVASFGRNADYEVECRILTEQSDFDTVTNKFCYRATVIGTTVGTVSDTDPIEVSYSDDGYQNFSHKRYLTTRKNWSLHRLGFFRRRAWKIRYTGRDRLRIEGLELDLRASGYA